MENRHGLFVKAQASHASGTAEREVALELLAELPGSNRCTVGADKNYDTAHFVQECRAMNITPHVAMNNKRPGGSAIDDAQVATTAMKQANAIESELKNPLVGANRWD